MAFSIHFVWLYHVGLVGFDIIGAMVKAGFTNHLRQKLIIP